MGLFNSIFKAKEPKEEKVLPWIPLNSDLQLEMIADRSWQKPQIIFKHSTRCGVSMMVINQFIDNYSLNEADVDLYFLDIWNYRELSDEVGFKFQVLHQSPQLLIIRNGVTIANASHGSILSLNLNDLINK